MKFHRPERVSSLIREELNNLILRNLEFPNCLVTITGVAVSPKLEHAKVKINVIPREKILKVLKILEENRRRLQHLLLKKINIKPMPQIRFEVEKFLPEEQNK